MTYRHLNFTGFLICVALLSAAYYFQHFQDLEPCPLCIFQRVAFFAMGIFFLLSTLITPKGGLGRLILTGLTTLSGLTGILIAGRHLWLQNLPADQVPSCGPGLDFMLEQFAFSKVLSKVLSGSGECAEISWQFLGLSMPAWAAVWFVLLTILAVITYRRT